MNWKPMLFSAPMVRASFEDRKTQTRRMIKPQPIPVGESSYGGTRSGWCWKPDSLNRSWNDDDADPYRITDLATTALSYEAPHRVGSGIWGKETYLNNGETIAYRAGGELDPAPIELSTGWIPETDHWRPSIFMPKWAARLFFEVVEVRVERLQDISEEDAIAEGLSMLTKDNGVTWKWGIPDSYGLPGNDDHGWHWSDWAVDPRWAYCRLWNSINGPGSWQLNPWVWVYSLKRMDRDQAIARGLSNL